MSKFEEFVNNRGTTSLQAKELLREIQIVFNGALNSSVKVNGFGIDQIKIDFINEQETSQGLQINFEANGSAVAKNKDHVANMLKQLVNATREDLWRKNIFLEMLYHELYTSENSLAENATNTPLGLKQNLYFHIICLAIIFK